MSDWVYVCSGATEVSGRLEWIIINELDGVPTAVRLSHQSARVRQAFL